MSKRVAAIGVWTALLLGGPQHVVAGDLALNWQAPRHCPDREQWRAGLSQRVGREVTLDDAAPLGVWGRIEAREDGYELELRTRSLAGSERRKFQARSCLELARASLLLAALLLTPAQSSPRVTRRDDAAESRDWFVSLRARLIGDLGSLASASVGPGFSLGLGLHATRFELGAFMLPPRDLRAEGPADRGAALQLMAASAGVCHAFFRAVTFGPCAQLEVGRLRGSGAGLAEPGAASATWLAGALGVRSDMRLFGAFFGYLQAWGGAPFVRPTFAIRGLGPVFEVPAIIGRLELGIEGRL